MNNDDWLKLLTPHDTINMRHLLALYSVFGIPKTYLDIGCGTGVMPKTARALGILAFGVDKIPQLETYIFQHDLENKFVLGAVCDRDGVEMITCLEVAEHLTPGADTSICDTMAENLLPGGMLVFSSAHPGQAGEGHIGVRPAYHWRTLLADRKLAYRDDWTKRLALVWSHIGSPLMWLPANIQVFEK